jgi:hypothetical protein
VGGSCSQLAPRVADGRNRAALRLQSQVWRGYLKGVVFYSYRSRMAGPKDSGRHEGEDSSRHAGGDIADRRNDESEDS